MGMERPGDTGAHLEKTSAVNEHREIVIGPGVKLGRHVQGIDLDGLVGTLDRHVREGVHGVDGPLGQLGA